MLSSDNYNYFSITDPDYGDSLLITKNYELPRLRKQLTSKTDLNQMQYGDSEIYLSLLNNELSSQDNTITEFFTELHTPPGISRNIKCLCIIDSGITRWAGFVKLPVEYDLSFSDDGNTLKVIAYDAMVEWMAIASTKLPENAPLDTNVPFRQYLADYVMNKFFMYFTCNFSPQVQPGNVGGEAVFNTRLMHMVLAGNNDNFNIYNFVKGICKEWGLVYKFEVPEDYTGYGVRVPLTFRIMERSEGRAITPQFKDPYIRTQIPKIDKPYVLLLNRRYTLTSNITDTVSVVKDIGHGILVNKDNVIITDNFDYYVAGDEPNNCFIYSVKDVDSGGSIEDEDYKGFLTVQQGGVIVNRIPLADIHTIDTEYFVIHTRSTINFAPPPVPPSVYHTFKFGIYPSNWNGSLANVVTDNKITATRLFTGFYQLDYTYYMADNTYYLNANRAGNLRLLIDNNDMVRFRCFIKNVEPDLFDTFTIEHNEATETYSVTGIEPDVDANVADGEAIKLI